MGAVLILVAAICGAESVEELRARIGQDPETDDWVVNVARPMIGHVSLHLGDSLEASKEPLLKIALSIESKNQNRKLDYKGWGPKYGLAKNPAYVRDEFGNRYKPLSFGLLTVDGQVMHTQAVYPGKPLQERLVFERPIDAAQFLILELPGEAMGVVGRFEAVMYAPGREPEVKKAQAATPARKLRTWTSKAGTELVAELIDFQDGKAHLQKESGDVLEVKIGDLSKQDQAVVREAIRRKAKAEPLRLKLQP